MFRPFFLFSVVVLSTSGCHRVLAPKPSQLTEAVAVSRSGGQVEVGPYLAVPMVGVPGGLNVLKDNGALTAISCQSMSGSVECEADIGYSFSLRAGKRNTLVGTARLNGMALDLQTSNGITSRKQGTNAFHLFDSRKRWIASFDSGQVFFSEVATPTQRDAAALTVFAVATRGGNVEEVE